MDHVPGEPGGPEGDHVRPFSWDRPRLSLGRFHQPAFLGCEVLEYAHASDHSLVGHFLLLLTLPLFCCCCADVPRRLYDYTVSLPPPPYVRTQMQLLLRPGFSTQEGPKNDSRRLLCTIFLFMQMTNRICFGAQSLRRIRCFSCFAKLSSCLAKKIGVAASHAILSIPRKTSGPVLCRGV